MFAICARSSKFKATSAVIVIVMIVAVLKSLAGFISWIFLSGCSLNCLRCSTVEQHFVTLLPPSPPILAFSCRKLAQSTLGTNSIEATSMLAEGLLRHTGAMADQYRKRVAKKVRAYREKLALSQEALAERADMH